MKCKHCGEEIANDSVFCEHCGTKTGDSINEAMATILDVATAEDKPLAALQARRKCYKLCKKEFPDYYREQVKKILIDRYPIVFEKCKVGIKFVIIVTILVLVLGALVVGAGVSGCILNIVDDPLFIVFFFILLPLSFIVLSVLYVRKWYKKQLQQINQILKK